MGTEWKEMTKYHWGDKRMSRERRELSTEFLKEGQGLFQAKIRDAS